MSISRRLSSVTSNLLRPLSGWSVPCTECGTELDCTLGWPRRDTLEVREGPPWFCMLEQPCTECGHYGDLLELWSAALGRYWWRTDPLPPQQDVKDPRELHFGWRLWFWLAQAMIDRLAVPAVVRDLEDVLNEEG